MDHAQILVKAWRILWKHKVMWIFGWLASCSTQAGGGGTGSGWSPPPSAWGSFDSNDFKGFPQLEGVPPWMQPLITALERMAQDGTLWVVITLGITALVCLGLILSGVMLVASTFGRIGLVRAAWLADEGAVKLRFGELWRQSRPFFWRVLGLRVLLAVFGLVAGAFLILPGIIFTVLTLGCGLILLIPLLLVAFWLLGAWEELTTTAIAGENLGLIDGMRRGWELLRGKIAAILGMALILYVGSGILGLLIAIPSALIVVPAFMGLIMRDDTLLVTGLVVSAVLFLIYLPIAVVYISALHAYLGAAWTLIFRRLTGRTEEDAQPAPA